MSLLRSIASGLRSLFRKEQVGRELDEELNGFLGLAAEEKMQQGMSRKEALRAVRLERGNLEVEGNRPDCRLGVACGYVLAGFPLRCAHSEEMARIHDRRYC